MKFLVIRFSSIGDIVLATPAIRCLKKQIITSEVHFLTKQSFRIVTASNPYIDKFFYLDNNMDALIHELRQEEYDYIIDLHNNFRSIKIKRALGVKAYVIDKLNVEKFLLTKLRINIMPRRHITTRSLDTIKPFGITDDGLGLDYFIPEKDRVKESDIPASHLAGYIAIVIGASYATKKMPVHKLKALCEGIQHPIILIGGKEDREEGEQVMLADPGKIYNACGKFNLNESADLVRRAKLVISHDTGLQYIASAFNKPVLAIWGSTSPKLDVEPYYGSAYLHGSGHLPPKGSPATTAGPSVAETGKPPFDTISGTTLVPGPADEPAISGDNGQPYENILVPGLRCQPCSKYGNRKCPLGHFKCMENMDIAYIIERAEARLGRR